MADSSIDSRRQSVPLFELLVQSVQDYAIFALHADGTIGSWNRGAEQLKGYTAEQAVGRNYSMFFTPLDRTTGEPERLLGEAARVGRVTAEGWRVRQDGSLFWASAVLTALRGDDGRLIGFAKVTRDLTERRNAEEAARIRERQLEDAQALAGLGSWEWDVAADRVTWSDELYRIYGLEPRTFAATFPAYLERVHPEDRAHVQQVIGATVASGTDFDFEERIVRPDGEIRILRSRGRALRDESGSAVRLMGACLDITEVWRAQHQAMELARQESARQAAEEAVRRLDFLVRAGEVLVSSLDFEAMLRSVADLCVPEIADWCAIDLLQTDGTLRRVAAAPVDGTVGTHAVVAERPREGGQERAGPGDDGARSALKVPLPGRAGPLGALVLAMVESGRRLGETDVRLAQELARHAASAIDNARLHAAVEERNALLESQAAELELQAEELQEQAHQAEDVLEELRVANEALLERTAEAEQANRAKAQFLAAMSHELRTPLNAIFGYADLIDLGIHGPITAKQADALERIKRNQRALLGLINDILSFARVDAKRLEIVIDDVRVADVLSDLEPLIGPQLLESEITFACLPCPADLIVRGERERIDQIVLNLLTNALKFTPTGGSIHVSAEAAAGEVLIRVSDTGCGIPGERQQAIFDPFVQVSQMPGRPAERGIGLGLAISRELAAAMGGSLSVTSTPGRGSTFTLALPRARS